MVWRASWMRERLSLMGLALWDLGVIAGAYNLIYARRLGAWPGLTGGLTAFVLVWLGGSYLLGRYSERPTPGLAGLWRALSATLTVALTVLLLFVGHSWLFAIHDAGTRFRGFLIPLLAVIVVLALGGQLLVGAASRRPSPWLLITSGVERDLLEQELGRRHPRLLPRTRVVTADQVELLLSGELDDTLVAISEQAEIHDSLLERLLALRSRGVRICSLVDWAETELQRVPPELLSDRWLLHADGFSIQPGRLRWRIKRLGDVIGALGLIVLTAPLILLGALMVRLEDGGPVLYSQIRTGLYGQPIRIWKLRSMRLNAEADGARWAARADPRITRSGSILRRLRIDELPQLFGVLAGDLSLIGPRPERPEIELDLEPRIPHYRVRHWIRPGLSGWAQVNYPYGASVEDSRMKLSFDLYYVRHSGLLLDLLITLKTIRLVLHARGAQPTA